MTDRITKVNEANVVKWMTQNGRPEYEIQINEFRATRDEVRAEAGRYWQECEFTQATLRKIDAEIADVEARAWERFIDWATD